jgi:Flp pilus assembly protein TadG
MKRNHSESGQALVAATFGLTTLLGAAGLAVDMGYLRYQKRAQQSAADSAALAGAAENAAGNATAAAREDALLNGYANGVNQVTVSVNPAFPLGAGTGVRVLVSAVQPTFFMRIFGINSTTISAAAVAVTSGAKNCMYALDGGTGITNNGTLNATGCGVVDDEGLFNTGSIHAASVAVHGTASGSPTLPAAITGIVEAGDPLFRLNPPGGGGCQPNGNVSGNGGGTVTLNPGRYCSGLTVTGNKNVTLRSGTYVVSASGINFNGTGTISGNGVTLYVRAAGGVVAINNIPAGSQTLLLRAPTVGALAGILFYQDRGNNQTANIDGNGTSRLEGALYFPAARLNLADTGSLAAYTLAVAKSLSLSGTVNLGSNFSTLPGGSPIKNAVLVE